MKIGEALRDVAALISSHGIRAATDARELALPGALVVPGPIAFDRLSRDYTAAVDVYLIVGDHGTTAALDELGAMLDKVRDDLGVSSATPETLTLINHAADPLPTLKLTVTLTVTDE